MEDELKHVGWGLVLGLLPTCNEGGQKYYILKYLFKIRINIKILYVDLFYKDLCIGCREIQLFAALHIFQIIGEVRKNKITSK